jgi:hypothetical protein
VDKPEVILASMTVTPNDAASPAETAAKGAAALVGAVMHVEQPASAMAAPAKPAAAKPEAIKADTAKTDAAAKAAEPMAANAAGVPAV